MRRKICYLMAVAMLMTGCAASGTASSSTEEVTVPATTESTAAPTTEPTTEAGPVDNEYELTEDNVKMLGRTKANNHVLWMAYSASGVEFKVKGKAASVMLYGDSTATGEVSKDGNVNQSGNKARYAIYIDEELFLDEIMNEGAKSVELFKGEAEREATVRIIKLSETANSTLGIRSVTVTDGIIEPTEEKPLYIEFVGDSITCGYGVDDEDKNHHFTTTTEDATKAYAYKTAQILNADYSLVSISGYGVVSGYTSDKKSDKQVMSLYYDKMGFSYAKSGGFSVAKWDWEFKRQPNVVVINLGTNDNSYVKNKEDRRQEYYQGYIELIKQIREKNPDAKIVCALGIMGDELFKTIEEAVAAYTEETGDKEVLTYHFDKIKPDEGYAADWHPTEKTHTRCAEEFSEFLKTIL